MRKTLCLLAALLLAPLPAAAQDQSALDEFRAAVAQMRAELLQPGERVEGWDRGGADPDAELRALGADRYYFLNRDGGALGVTILTDRPIADFAPAGWRIADSYGAAGEALETPQLDFMPFSARYVMASRARIWKQNDAGCWRNISHALLYEIPGTAPTEGDEIIPLMFRMAILALEDQTVCSRADGNRAGGYRTRFFLPDGRSLPHLSSPDDLVTIVPAAPIERLIRPAPPAPPGGAPPA
ncbi:MAG: hypothetical protein QOJ53_1310 [Sphingomonadales bacterium]|nr:hypothetical protein [Sphingomonadales bacterium]